MPAAVITSRDQLIQEITKMVMAISGGYEGMPVNLENVQFFESGRANCGGKIRITCLFINEEGNVCADMYRTGSAGCVDFICGIALNSADEKVLKQIFSALNDNRWSVADSSVPVKQKKKNIALSIKLPFIQKGA